MGHCDRLVAGVRSVLGHFGSLLVALGYRTSWLIMALVMVMIAALFVFLAEPGTGYLSRRWSSREMTSLPENALLHRGLRLERRARAGDTLARSSGRCGLGWLGIIGVRHANLLAFSTGVPAGPAITIAAGEGRPVLSDQHGRIGFSQWRAGAFVTAGRFRPR